MWACVRRAGRERASTARRRRARVLSALLLLLSFRGGSCGGALLGAGLVCARGLTERQRALCHAAPAAVAALGAGLSMAYAECRAQLAGHRWNCSGVGDNSYFGHVMPRATREAAFTYALAAAGAAHAVSAACARGDLPACGCYKNRLSMGARRGATEQFSWGECGEAAWGARFARRFLDARELEADHRSLMNLHNNRVGRKTVKDMVRRECKCHGVSGSCTVKTCWRALPAFRAVAAALADKYRRARLVTAAAGGALHGGKTQLVIKRGRAGAVGRAARRSELVFLEPSPSYCEPDAASGARGTHGRLCNKTSTGRSELVSLEPSPSYCEPDAASGARGTHGRLCNKTSTGPDGCESLCCGRGHSTVRAVSRTQCRCRFHWCCRVSCDTCLARTDTHVCN